MSKIKIEHFITRNPITEEKLSEYLIVSTEEGRNAFPIDVKDLDEVYRALGEKIAEMEVEAGATPGTEPN